MTRPPAVERIGDAFGELLAEGVSYRDLSVEQVIARADVARSTFYQHYDDRADVLRRLGHDASVALAEAFRVWSDRRDALTYDELRTALLGIAVAYRSGSEVFAAMAEGASTDPVLREEFGRLFRTGKTELAAHLRAAGRAGRTRDHVDPLRTSAWLVWMIERGLYQQVRPATERALRAEVTALTGIIWNAVYLEPASPAAQSPASGPT